MTCIATLSRFLG